MARRLLAGVIAIVLALGVFAAARDDDAPTEVATLATSTTTSTSTSTTEPTTIPPDPTSTSVVPAGQLGPDATTTTTSRPPIPRTPVSTAYAPYAAVGPVVLHHPADVVEFIGFHESGHDGAQPQSPTEFAARHGLLETRDRDTDPRGAADIVVDPTGEIRSPVTGTVVRAGSYTLYCDHRDHFLVIEPDARPGFEVKVLHFEGLQVVRGQRVEAGVTVVGSHARTLPFESQVDEQTATPAWPHVHVEVVDPSIPDRPTGGGCS